MHRSWLALFVIFVLLAPGVSAAKNATNEIPGPYDEISPYDYPFIDFPNPPGYGGWFGWGGFRGFGQEGGKENKESSGKPAVSLAFVVEPASRLYWKTETYDQYLGIPKDGIFWEKSNKSTQRIYSVKGTAGTPYTVYKVLDKGEYVFHLIKPQTQESWISMATMELDLQAGYYSVNSTYYGDYLLSAKIKNKTVLSYDAVYSYKELDPAGIGYLSDIPPDIRERYTQLPYKKLPGEVQKAHDLLYDSKLNVFNQSLLAKKYLLENVRYEPKWWENATPWETVDVASWTLRNGKGICTHFASTYVVLERSMGIPARLAIGYAGGKNIGNRTYVFTSFAHGWAEVYMPPYGWVPVEATGPYTPPNESAANNTRKMNISIIPYDLDVRPDLQETYEKKFEKEMEEMEQQLNQSNNSPYNLSELNSSYWNKSMMNMSFYNYSLWNSSYYNMSEWNTSHWNASYWNQTLWNQSDWNETFWEQLKENESFWNKTEEKSREQKNKSNLSKSPLDQLSQNPWQFIALMIVALALFLVLLRFISSRKRSHSSVESLPLKKLGYVDIMQVIERCKQYGEQEKYLEGVVYAYNELASYLCLNLKVDEDTSKTPRELGSQIVKKKDLDLSAVTYVFEKARYGENISKEDYSAFLSSLVQTAEDMKGVGA